METQIFGTWGAQQTVVISGNTFLTSEQAFNTGYFFGGSLSAGATIIWPTFYGVGFIENGTTGGQTLTCGISGYSPIVVNPNETVFFWCDGENFYRGTEAGGGIGVTGTGSAVLAANPIMDNSVSIVGTGQPSLQINNTSGSQYKGNVEFFNNGTIEYAISSDITSSNINSLSFWDSVNGTFMEYVRSSETTTIIGNLTVTGTLSAALYGYGINVVSYGADPTGVSQSDTAVANALDALPAEGGIIYFPPGYYTFNAAIEYSMSGSAAGITFLGAGMNATELTWLNATNGIDVFLNSPGHCANVRDMTLSTTMASSPGGTTGIIFQQSSPLNEFTISTIVRVMLRGRNEAGGTGGVECWGAGYYMFNVSGTTVDSVVVYGGTGPSGEGGLYGGTGVGGPSGINYSIYHNISKCIFNGLQYGVNYGQYAQGITLSQCNFQNGNICFVCGGGTGGELSQLNINDCQLSGSGNAIFIDTSIGNVTIRGCDIFGGPNAACILIGAGNYGTIIGNNCNCAGGTSTGIAINGVAFTVIGNVINQANIGVLLEAGSELCNVQGNVYNVVTTQVDNLGTNNSVGVATK